MERKLCWLGPNDASFHPPQCSSLQLTVMGTYWVTGRDDQVTSLPVMSVTPLRNTRHLTQDYTSNDDIHLPAKESPCVRYSSHVSCEPNNHHLGSSAVSTCKRSSQLGLLTVSPATPNNLSHAILLELHMALGWGKSILGWERRGQRLFI